MHMEFTFFPFKVLWEVWEIYFLWKCPLRQVQWLYVKGNIFKTPFFFPLNQCYFYELIVSHADSLQQWW